MYFFKKYFFCHFPGLLLPHRHLRKPLQELQEILSFHVLLQFPTNTQHVEPNVL